MKNLTFLLYLILAIGVFSCQKDDEQKPEIKEILTAQIEGKSFSATSFVLARAAQATSINGSAGSVTSPESISINIENMQVGTFELGEDPLSYAAYNSPVDEFLSSSGKVTITKITDEWIEGTFDFTAQSVNNPSLQVRLSNGEFRMKFD